VSRSLKITHERRNIMLAARFTAARVLAGLAVVGGFWLGLPADSTAGGGKLGIETVPLKDARGRAAAPLTH
jgi:hypothetical protein